MKKVIQIAIRDFQQTMKSPMSLVWMLVLPLVFTGFLGAVFGSIGASEEGLIPIGILTHSTQSDLLNSLQSEMESTAPIDWMEFDNEEKMRQDILNGKLSGGIIIPENASIEDLSGQEKSIILIADVTTSAGTTAEVSLRKAITRLVRANRIAEMVFAIVDDTYPYPTTDIAQAAENNLRSLAQIALQSPAVTIQTEAAVVSPTDLSTQLPAKPGRYLVDHLNLLIVGYGLGDADRCTSEKQRAGDPFLAACYVHFHGTGWRMVPAGRHQSRILPHWSSDSRSLGDGWIAEHHRARVGI